MLKGKKILIGVCGSIAAYKVPELVRLYIAAGAEVTVMMTVNARNFVAPITLQTLSGRPVITDLFEDGGIAHIDAVRRSDVFVLVPASANMLAKMAWGLADDSVSTAVLACDKPVLIAPAMNCVMWENPIVKRNVKMLEDTGYCFVQPETGDLACGEKGNGRLAFLEKILWATTRLITRADFNGKRVHITAGPTREYADPVRFISNASSGKMGFALALEAYFRGAEVTVVAGAVDERLKLPDEIRIVSVVSAVDMHKVVMREVSAADVFISSAAVCDYRFSKIEKNKLKKGSLVLRPEMVLIDDILAEVGKLKKRPFIVGFALESGRLIENARIKMMNKGVDMMVCNGIEALHGDSAEVTLLIGKKIEKMEKMLKESIARCVFDRIVKFI